ncbi:hypothetical protein PMI18_05942 [Pseudomonas sp. GM102]|uniref:Rieske 2Fe-2S domain-containing protein n=1 Tax=Pseudomonas sp. GM102 TaxID=1144321 RepID=UPI00026F6705|nr:Rieske 2Fe-2S domain-containing protein [Pseudomonas sp. GM102]EJL93390.1 hypothetical protein PMI18_05942 [Pseudomonas sp. GM102]
MTMSNLPYEKTTPSTSYPNGWFALCFVSDLKPKAVKTLPFMGKELVLYRTESGAVRAVGPFCPIKTAETVEACSFDRVRRTAKFQLFEMIDARKLTHQ